MAERVLVPIDQRKQLKYGWSHDFAILDVELRADNKETAGYITRTFIDELKWLGGKAILFTQEFDYEAVPDQFRGSYVVDLSLGARVVRLTTGQRVKDAVRYDVGGELHSTARNLDTKTWIFDADQIEDYVPPVAPIEPDKPRRKSLFSWT